MRVLNGISFDVRPGEVHALLGENGAGKSTLIKIIAGVQTADAGEMRVEGRPVRFSSPREAAAQGIATVYQELLLFPELSVAENIYIGHAPRTRWGSVDWSAMRAGARALLDSLDSHDLDVDAIVGRLSVANRQRVEIAKALSQNAKLVIMDEPTAALADADARRLLEVVRRLRERGVGIAYVTHKLSEVFALADRVTVLRDGAHVATKPIGEVERIRSGLDDGGPRHRPALSEGRDGAGRGRSRAARPLLRRGGPRYRSDLARRRDPRHRRADRLGKDRARPHHLRHHPGDIGRDPGQGQAGLDPQPRRRHGAWASPMCRRIAGCRG